MARVLIVDDERGVRFTLAELLRGDGHEVETAADASEATQLLADRPFDVVVTDIILPRISGMDLLEEIRGAAPDVQIVVITGEPTVTTAARAVRAQAFDYLPKPVSGEAIRKVVAAAAQVKELADENRRLQEEVRQHRDRLQELVDTRTRELSESEERFRLITDEALMGVGMADLDRRITYVNRRLAEILGYPRDATRELVGLRFTDFVHPDERAWVARASSARTAETDPSLYAMRMVTRDGETRFVELSVKLVMHAGEPVTLVNVIDVTERARLEEHLRQTQKMEAIGTLAGGVAHDINNVLGAIMGLASLLEAEMEPGDRKLADIEDILAACRRGRDLMQNLLGFARRGEHREEPVELSRIVGTVVELLGHTVSKKIEISTDLAEGLPTVMGDPRQIHHALMNVCLNAVEAVGDDGSIRISAEPVMLGDGELSPLSDLETGRYCLLRVEDDGVGMDEQALERAFEPFYTTKEGEGRSSGLGLAMAYGTFRNHGGLVTLDSAPGEGTTVSIYLPAGEGPGERVEPAGLPAGSEAPPGQTVLLVDDEAIVRAPGKRMLEALGYAVLVAGNGEEAVSVYEERGGEIAVVILDLTMPVMDGAETFHRIREIDPEARVLLCSGHSVEGNAAALLREGAVGFVQKPFDLRRLEVEIRAAAAAPRGGATGR